MNTIESFVFEQHMEKINTKWDEFSQEIKDVQGPDIFSILYATDIHYIRKFAMYVPAYYKVKEMVEFSQFAGFDLLALTGDLVDGNTTLKRQKRDLGDLISLVREAKTTAVLISKGNHDDCSWYAYKNSMGIEAVLSPEAWYSYVVNPIRVQYPITVDTENITGGYYYIDYPLHKIRVININTNDLPVVMDEEGKLRKEYCGQWNFGISEKQLKWLVETLSFEEDGWSVVFMSHEFLTNEQNDKIVRNGDLAWKIIQAYKRNEKGSVTSEEAHLEAHVQFDFTNNQSNDVLVYMFGHRHVDLSFVLDGITAIATKNLLGNVKKNWDDINETIDGGWDCVFIDKKRRKLQIKRYGVSGSNREVEL
ncbi:MAG: metallophosphoesterase [Lachnospiraceae bacterium]|nr:metallophosphoesterase [Lachnospiraceae bacterium]